VCVSVQFTRLLSVAPRLPHLATSFPAIPEAFAGERRTGRRISGLARHREARVTAPGCSAPLEKCIGPRTGKELYISHRPSLVRGPAAWPRMEVEASRRLPDRLPEPLAPSVWTCSRPSNRLRRQ
jgi:hypothetical protein